ILNTRKTYHKNYRKSRRKSRRKYRRKYRRKSCHTNDLPRRNLAGAPQPLSRTLTGTLTRRPAATTL
ncbi:hypothetical protein BGZ88_005342, partial [Linnemannia elongata]